MTRFGKIIQVEGEEIPPPKPDFSAPPPYEVATKLPSYEEVQREKTLQGEPQPQVHMVQDMSVIQNVVYLRSSKSFLCSRETLDHHSSL